MQLLPLSNPAPAHGAAASDGKAVSTTPETGRSDFAQALTPDAQHQTPSESGFTIAEADQPDTTSEMEVPDITATRLPDTFDPETEMPREGTGAIAADPDPQSPEHSAGLGITSHEADSDQNEQPGATSAPVGAGSNRSRASRPGDMVQSIVSTFVTHVVHQPATPIPQIEDLTKTPTRPPQRDAFIGLQRTPLTEATLPDAQNVRQPPHQHADRFAQIATGAVAITDPVRQNRQAPDAQVQNTGPGIDHLTRKSSLESIINLGKTDENIRHSPKSENAQTDALPRQFKPPVAIAHSVPAKTQAPHANPASQVEADHIVRFSTEATPEITLDLRAHGSFSSTSSQNLAPRPEMPVRVAQQLAQAMHRAPDRPLEIALNPAELGRVRMTLTATEAGIVVNILADRPDTLDLMRRNIDDLGQSFSELGYEDIAFAFGQNDDPSDASENQQSDGNDVLRIDLEDKQPGAAVASDLPRLAINAQGVDLRL